MFWKRKESSREGEIKLPGPKSIPELPGRHMVLEEKKDPNWVWNLKGVVHPTEKKEAFYCRVYNPSQTATAGIEVKDWTSLNGHPELVIWEGYFDKKTNVVRRENFAG